MGALPFIRSPAEALENIDRFETQLAEHPELQDRLGHVHSWYAHRRPDGSWLFGPSKFVGYQNNSGEHYLASYNAPGGAHGGKTEFLLKKWFQTADPDSRIGREVLGALSEFLTRWNRTPRKGLRINVLRPEFDEQSVPSGASEMDFLARISVDPRICGGRPCIKGTRMRVSDVVEMIAGGATRGEVLADFPYLTDQDITASLAYAAHAVDHRVVLVS